MEDLVFLDFCERSGTLKAMRILGSVITILKILIPAVIIITEMVQFTKSILEENDTTSAAVKSLITKVVIGAFIFFVPTIFNAILGLVNGTEENQAKFLSCTSCMADTKGCASLISTAEDNETIIALSKAEEFLTKKEAAIVKKEKLKEEARERAKEKKSHGGVAVIPGANGYGRGCSSYVPSSSYNASIANHLIERGSTRLGEAYVYGKFDCSKFMSWTIAEYHGGGTAASLGQSLSSKCVQANDVRPGDLFFSSRYNSSYQCTNCEDTGRCDRWQCIMHIGMVYEVKDGKVTKILHNGSTKTGVEIRDFGYGYAPDSAGNSWVIQFSRPYA